MLVFSPFPLQVLLPRTKSVLFQRFNQKSGKKKVETVGGGMGGGGELEVGKTPLSEFGGDRLKEMEKIHAMEENEVDHTSLVRYSGTICLDTSI